MVCGIRLVMDILPLSVFPLVRGEGGGQFLAYSERRYYSLQLFVVAQWFAVFAKMLERRQTATLGWIWLGVYTLISFILPCYYLLSLAHYERP